MNQKFLRLVDSHIGRPFCFFLTLHKRFCEFFIKNSPNTSRPSRILFIKLIEQGSTVLSYPAIKKGIDLVGKDNVFFLIFSENRPILDILGIIPASNIFEIDLKNPIRAISSTIKALQAIKHQKIDAAIDMEFFSRGSAVISYLSGAKKRVGFHRFMCEGPYRGNLFTHRLIYNPYLHTSTLFAGLIEALNHQPASDGSPMIFKAPEMLDSPPNFIPTEDEKRVLAEKIEGLKKSSLGKPIIVLNPSINDLLPVRRWPRKNFASLGKMILEEFQQATIIITGVDRDKSETEILAEQLKGISLAGQTSLRELLTLYHIADLLITSDSGPAHFAALTPVKTIAFFGPETPILYGEKSNNIEIVTSGLACSPCLNVYNHRNSPCKKSECLKRITPQEIFKKVKIALSPNLQSIQI